ncbi:SPOR domain-containing protein [Paracoccus luteus]|uniref:SPOR domain-containing protein n=1 Tax=Paracoccus luteus TaxID=2508543 RepID=UPI00106FB413|nr:SPOR domain-containing protein [Paracoccus luteus]
MTVLDFRAGGYDGARGRAGHGVHDESLDDFLAHDWPDEAWDDARPAGAPARITDRDSVLGRVARLTHYLGALVSVLLMCALAVWGYRLVVRDVSGVPVIRAVEGDARIAPDNPGGELSDRTGLAVNAVAAGTGAAPVERVAIAPAPTALSGQDVAMGELGATAHEPAAASDQPLVEDAADTVALTDAEAARLAADQAAADTAADTAALAQVPAVAPGDTDAQPVGAAVTTADGRPAQDTAITAALAEAGAVPSVTTANRPLPRPRRLAAAAPASDAAPVAALAIAPESAPAAEPPAAARPAAGAPLVQIGAFDSNAIAQSEFTRVSGRFGALFSGKAPVVQEHQVNGRTFYRLRVAGFDSRDDARRFCAALIEAGTDCIPAVAK